MVGGTVGPVFAEPVPEASAADPSAGAGGGFEEIVVTARRRDERVQTVPIAITAFSQADLDERHVEQLRDLANSVPSLSVNINASDVNSLYSGQLRIRGLPGAEVYFAGAPIDSTDRRTTTGLTHGLSPGYYFDLESLEVYKGAQGTLFGRPSIGGLFAIEPKRPTDSVEGYIQTEAGNYGENKNEFALNVPVVEDKLLVRVSGQMQQRDGYTLDLQNGAHLDNQNYYAWRVGVTLKPSDDFENYLVYDGYWQDSDGSSVILKGVNPNLILSKLNGSGIVLPPGSNAGCLITVTLGGPDFGPLGNLPGGCGNFRVALEPDLQAALARQNRLGPRTIAARTTSGIGKDYLYGFTDNARWDVSDALTIKNIASARVTKQLSSYDFTNTGLGVLSYGFPGNNHGWNDNSAQYTEEFHLEGLAAKGRLNWTAGGFLSFGHPIGYDTEVYDAIESATFNHYQESDRSQAVFAHGIYDLSDYVSDLRFSAGYRYSWDYASLGLNSTRPAPPVLHGVGAAPPECFLVLSDDNCFRAIDSYFKSSSWNLGLDQQITPNTLVYIRSGNTYRPGGVNPSLKPPRDRFGSEHETDVEIGIKTDWSIGGIQGRTNADIFHAFYDNIQVSQLMLIESPSKGRPPSIQPIIANAASANLDGVEIEQTLSLPQGVDLSGQGSYFNAQYNHYPASLGGGDPGFQYVPRFSFALTGLYHLPVDAALGKISAAVTWSWSGHQSVSPLANEPINSIPHYQNFDIHADWTDMFGRPFDAAFFMTNATDNLHATGAVPLMTTLGITSLTYDPPRMYGFSLKYRFGPNL